jgi:hypothetical protein
VDKNVSVDHSDFGGTREKAGFFGLFDFLARAACGGFAAGAFLCAVGGDAFGERVAVDAERGCGA